ncbi:MAG: 50S ribosomal protein L15 [Candidatus Yanofskybacteria bacterium RIFCSPHIGHO2_02_FULL_43_22]|uniref:Large ribosomal subunit protein uL15 n=1 Tax=Candidatus Yanofskybacteria bacterium RIFCSPHIGHO2_02_FULL_43_22 TaxID=1802681 RepID=A0A1F8FNC4_9BACT|nr:MAG: 50S ribosomal protein L15 [Candidatus Yanofskybacteria bacterium RIFCSPHIGHO2_02_FULL_43_22]
MNLSQLKPNTVRKSKKRVGRGGKRGTFSGKGSKGQKSRAGAGVKPGFRGGDNRIWQLFPKQRGASKKPGGKGLYAKHRFYQLRHNKSTVVNIKELNKFTDGDTITPQTLFEKGVLSREVKEVKVLGDGELSKKLVFEGFSLSKSARDKVIKAGGTIKENS